MPAPAPAQPGRTLRALPHSTGPSFETVLILALALALVPGSALALGYVNASPAGAQFPQWEGGDTELEFADMNGDGHADLISIGDHGNPYVGTNAHGIMVYFTDGAGGWSIHQEGDFGYGGIAAGDVNNDGLMDVGYGMHHDYASGDLGDQLIEVALGDGTGASWTPWDNGLATNGEDWGMASTDLADFDNDGDLDLVSNSLGCCNGVHVYRNNGDGTWTQTFASVGGNATCSVCTGDVNGDGLADVAAGYEHGCIYLGDGEGGFVSADAGLPGIGSTGLRGLSLGDVDGDGCQDLAFVQSERVHVYAWRGDHWEPASTGLPASGFYGATQLCDLDSDGDVDLAAMGDGTCTVWLGDGTGTWSAGGGFSAPAAVDTQAFRMGGDIDHNGRPDAALVQEQGSWPNYRNYLHVFRESSVPSARFIRARYPRGHETFYIGSVQSVRWSAARLGAGSAVVNIDVSYQGATGPWTAIATGVPDNGCRQWTVAGPMTTAAWLRVTLIQEGQSVADLAGPFTLLSSEPAAVDAGAGPASTANLRLAVSPQPVTGPARWHLAAFGRGGETPAGSWTVHIHDAAGRVVRRLALRGGTAVWDVDDSAGAPLPAGIYLARAARDGGIEGVGRRFAVVR